MNKSAAHEKQYSAWVKSLPIRVAETMLVESILGPENMNKKFARLLQDDLFAWRAKSGYLKEIPVDKATRGVFSDGRKKLVSWVEKERKRLIKVPKQIRDFRAKLNPKTRSAE